jgi:hypothetical protein
VAEVNGRIDAGNPALEATRADTVSPFAPGGGRVLCLGGFDCNFVRCSDTAWTPMLPRSCASCYFGV